MTVSSAAHDRRWLHAWGRVLLIVVGLIALLFSASLLGQGLVRLFGGPPLVAQVVSSVLVLAGSVGLVFLFCRVIDRGRWQDMALPLSAVAWRHLAVGILLAVVAIGAAQVLGLALGIAQPTGLPAGVPVLGYVVQALIPAFVLQGFPEELVFRGYVFHRFKQAYPLWLTLVLTSVVFASIHFLSNSGASSMGQQLVYVVMAGGLGLLATAARIVSGTVWTAVGVHGGFHLAIRFIPIAPAPQHYSAWLLLATTTLTAVAALCLAGRHRRAPLPWRELESPRVSHP